MLKKTLSPSAPNTLKKMQLLSILVATVWAITAAAQGITIESPPQGKTVHPGNKLTIKVIKNVSGPSFFPHKPNINVCFGFRTTLNRQLKLGWS